MMLLLSFLPGTWYLFIADPPVYCWQWSKRCRGVMMLQERVSPGSLHARSSNFLFFHGYFNFFRRWTSCRAAGRRMRKSYQQEYYVLYSEFCAYMSYARIYVHKLQKALKWLHVTSFRVGRRMEDD